MRKQDTVLYVLIADHEPEVRQALRLVCEECLDLTIAAEAADTEELLTQVKTAQPDILLLEWELPAMQPTALIDELRLNRCLSIIVLGGHPEMRINALEAGADGFVYKGDPPDQLIHLLQSLIAARLRKRSRKASPPDAT